MYAIYEFVVLMKGIQSSLRFMGPIYLLGAIPELLLRKESSSVVSKPWNSVGTSALPAVIES